MKVSDMFPSRYLTGSDLKREYTVTIKELLHETVQTSQGKKEFYVLYFDNAEKGLILNRTNAEAIAALYSDETNAWPGRRIVLYPVQIKVAGEQKTAIRIKPPTGVKQ